MLEILHDLIYIHMYHTTRIPRLLVYEVYIKVTQDFYPQL